MRDRLIELLLSKSCMTNECPDADCEECECIAVHTGDADKIADYLLDNGVIVPNKDIKRQTANIKKYEKEFDEIAKDLFKIDEDYTGGAKVWIRTDVYKKLTRILALSNHLVKVLRILLTREEAEEKLKEGGKGEF